MIVRPPRLQSKPPSPLPEESQQGPQRRGTQTPRAASDQNSYPFQQGPGDGVGYPPQTGPTRDPRRNAVLSLSPPILLPNPTSSLHPESYPSQPTPSIPSLPQSLHGMHPSRLVRLRADVFNPVVTNSSETPLVANLTSGPLRNLPTRPVSMSSSGSSLSTPTGMHPDRIPLLSAHHRPFPTVASTRPSPYAASGDPRPHQTPGERSAESFWRSPVFPSENYSTVLPRDGSIPSSSRLTLDGVAASITPGPLLPGSFIASLNSGNQPTPTETYRSPDLSPNRNKKGKAAQKRKASEVLSPPIPSKPPKIPKTKKRKRRSGKNTGGPGAWGGLGKKKVKVIGQPGPSNNRHGKSSVEGGGHREDGEVWR